MGMGWLMGRRLRRVTTLRADSDQDGLSDGQEVSFGSNPLVADTDGDRPDNEEFSLVDPTVDDCLACVAVGYRNGPWQASEARR